MEQWRNLLERKQKAQKLVDLYKAKVMEHRLEKSMSREMYSRLFEPVTQKLEGVSGELGKKLEDVGENVQLAIEGIPTKLEDVQRAIEDTQKTDLEMLFAEPPAPPEMPAIEPPGRTTALYANLDAGIDENVLREHGFLPVTTVLEGDVNELELIADRAALTSRQLGTKKSHLSKAKKDTSEIQRGLDTLKKYYERLRSLAKHRTVVGRGHAYKVSHGGKYGNLTIDLPELLGHHRLKAQRGGELVLDVKADQDLVDLLTKRFNRQKNYSLLSQKLFRQLSDLQTSSKQLCSPEELVNQLELICGSIRAGNDSQVEKINGLGIIDKLLKLKRINKDTHEGLYRKYFE